MKTEQILADLMLQADHQRNIMQFGEEADQAEAKKKLDTIYGEIARITIKQEQEDFYRAVMKSGDYERSDLTTNGVSYWLPNDETRYVVAVSSDRKLAVRTNFYELDDFYPITIGGETFESDYAFSVNCFGYLANNI